MLRKETSNKSESILKKWEEYSKKLKSHIEKAINVITNSPPGNSSPTLFKQYIKRAEEECENMTLIRTHLYQYSEIFKKRSEKEPQNLALQLALATIEIFRTNVVSNII